MLPVPLSLQVRTRCTRLRAFRAIGFGKLRAAKQTSALPTYIKLRCAALMENLAIFNLMAMKKKLLVIIGLLFAIAAKAQHLDQKSTAFLVWFFANEQKMQVKRKGNFYLSQLNKYQIAGLKKLFKSDTLHHLRLNRTDTAQFMVLSAKDKCIINQQIDELAAQKLPKKILPELEVLHPDTLKSFGPWHTFWQTAHNKGVNGYYTFSRPIFFNNGKYCVFFWNFNCGNLCGYGDILIYRKTKLGWKKHIVLSNWIS